MTWLDEIAARAEQTAREDIVRLHPAFPDPVFRDRARLLDAVRELGKALELLTREVDSGNIWLQYVPDHIRQAAIDTLARVVGMGEGK